MDCGTVMSRSMTDGAPSRLPVLTTTVFPTSETSTRPRRPVSPCTLTRFSLQPWTVIPPPKLLTERLAAANVATMFVLLLGSSRGHVVHTPQQLHLAPHRIGEVKIQVRVAGVLLKRDARVSNRPIDDREVHPHDAHGGGVESLLILRQRGLQVGDRRVGMSGPGDQLPHPGPLWGLAYGRRLN